MKKPAFLSSLTPRLIGAVAVTLAIGAAGGFVAEKVTLPLPWLIGALLITLALALSGVKLQGPGKLRTYMTTLLGVMLGSGFTPDIFSQAVKWPISLAAVLIFIITVGGGLIFWLYKSLKLGFANSFFAASPGALAEMVILAREFGGDERVVTLMHSVRLMLTVLIIPFWYRFYYDYTPAARAATAEASSDIALFDLALLIACAVIGYLGGRKIRLPAYQILGPLLLSAALHISGVTSANLPELLVDIAQVVFGAALGCQFVGISLREVSRLVMASAGITVAFIGGAAVFAGILEALTGLPFKVLLLAFAPGGIVEMTLISLSLNIDIAFISTHHVFRVIFLLLAAPLIFLWIAPKFGVVVPPKDERH